MTLHTLLHVTLFNLLLILILSTSISTTGNNVAFLSTYRTTTTVATSILLFSSVHRTTSNIIGDNFLAEAVFLVHVTTYSFPAIFSTLVVRDLFVFREGDGESVVC